MSHIQNICPNCGGTKSVSAKTCWSCFSQSRPPAHNKKENVTHGDRLMYTRGCRCEECMRASRTYRARLNNSLTNEERRQLPCSKCGLEEKLKGMSVGKECFALRVKRWNRNAHGILSYEQFEILLEIQDFVCAICGNPEPSTTSNGRKQDLAEDHKHGTNIVRGLLCSKCNKGIGHFFDDPVILRKAADYLERQSVSKEDLKL